MGPKPNVTKPTPKVCTPAPDFILFRHRFNFWISNYFSNSKIALVRTRSFFPIHSSIRGYGFPPFFWQSSIRLSNRGKSFFSGFSSFCLLLSILIFPLESLSNCSVSLSTLLVCSWASPCSLKCFSLICSASVALMVLESLAYVSAIFLNSLQIDIIPCIFF